jgi:hypothetical protein
MAEGVKNIVEEVFGWDASLYEDPILKETPLKEWPFIEPRWPLMDIANWMREKYGGDVWPRRWERLATGPASFWGCHVITDMRFPEEVEMIKRLGGALIYISRPEAEEALFGAQKAGNKMALNASESHYVMLREAADYLIENTGSVKALQLQLMSLVTRHYEHWTWWPCIEPKPNITHLIATGDL